MAHIVTLDIPVVDLLIEKSSAVDTNPSINAVAMRLSIVLSIWFSTTGVISLNPKHYTQHPKP